MRPEARACRLGGLAINEITALTVTAAIEFFATLTFDGDRRPVAEPIVAEIVREKVLLNTEREVPHSVAVEVNEYKERSETMTYVSATVYVERDSQKGILIGKGGAMLKKISSEARIETERLVGTKVYLELHVKVLKNWRRDENMLRRFGYRLGK